MIVSQRFRMYCENGWITRRIMVIRIPDSGKLQVESGILNFGIRNSAQRIRNPINDWNPAFKFHWKEIWNPQRAIQNPRLPWVIPYMRRAKTNKGRQRRTWEAKWTDCKHAKEWVFSLFDGTRIRWNYINQPSVKEPGNRLANIKSKFDHSTTTNR